MTELAELPTVIAVNERLVGADLQHEIEQFLYYEAELLDDRRFADWFSLLADDLRYWAPVRTNRLVREVAEENTRPGAAANFDDDKASLQWRLTKLGTGSSWGEDPPSRTRRLVSNVRIVANGDDEYEVRSNLLLYRNRLEVELDVFAAQRIDVLRRLGTGSWQVASRTILIDQAVILAKNISMFF